MPLNNEHTVGNALPCDFGLYINVCLTNLDGPTYIYTYAIWTTPLFIGYTSVQLNIVKDDSTEVLLYLNAEKV